MLCKDTDALLHVISLLDWPKHVKSFFFSSIGHEISWYLVHVATKTAPKMQPTCVRIVNARHMLHTDCRRFTAAVFALPALLLLSHRLTPHSQKYRRQTSRRLLIVVHWGLARILDSQEQHTDLVHLLLQWPQGALNKIISGSPISLSL